MTCLFRPVLPFRMLTPAGPAAPRRSPRPGPAPGGPGPQVTITVESVPGTTTVFICGELDLVTMPVLAESLARISLDRAERLVLDLAGTAFMDCASARLLVASARPGTARPLIRHPAPMVRRILELTGLDAFCDMQT